MSVLWPRSGNAWQIWTLLILLEFEKTTQVCYSLKTEWFSLKYSSIKTLHSLWAFLVERHISTHTHTFAHTLCTLVPPIILFFSFPLSFSLSPSFSMFYSEDLVEDWKEFFVICIPWGHKGSQMHWRRLSDYDSSNSCFSATV